MQISHFTNPFQKAPCFARGWRESFLGGLGGSVANSKNGYKEMNVHLIADEKIPVNWTIIVLTAQSISSFLTSQRFFATEPVQWWRCSLVWITGDRQLDRTGNRNKFCSHKDRRENRPRQFRKATKLSRKAWKPPNHLLTTFEEVCHEAGFHIN